MGTEQEKAALREQTLRLRKNLNPEYVISSNQAIFQIVTGLEEYNSANTVFCFVSTDDEIDTIPLLRHTLERGKRLAVPRCTGKGVMELCLIRGLDELEPGFYGIREPKRDCPIVTSDKIGFAIVPCVSCDWRGNRLGYGGGYYDRYLSSRFRPDAASAVHTAAICRELLLCESIPVGEYDIPVEMVINESMVYRAKLM